MTTKQAGIAVLFALSISLLLLIPGQPHIFVSPYGNDSSTGTTSHPVKSIQQGIQLARNGGTVHILPGTYRETLRISQVSGSNRTLRLHAEIKGNERVVITGAEPSSRLEWDLCSASKCPGLPEEIRRHVYVTSLPWDESPTIINETLRDGSQQSLTRARSPNVQVEHPDKLHEFWWQATGQGQTQSALADRTHLIGAPDMKGGRALIMDGAQRCGTFLYARTVTAHDSARGTLTMDAPIGALTYGHQETGASQYTKYFVDNALGLLDTRGEYYYDSAAHALYLWPLEPENPNVLPIEIGKRDTGILLARSHVELDGITITAINDHDYFNAETGAVVFAPNMHAEAVRLLHMTISSSGNGIRANMQGGGKLRAITIDHADMSGISKLPVSFIGPLTDPDAVSGVRIVRSTITKSGFPFNESAIFVSRASRVRIEHNTVSDVASYGIHITGYEKTNTPSKNISVAGNTVIHACQNASGCAAIKIFGGSFTETTVRSNTVRDNLGWSYCQEATTGKPGYAMGIFISNASGVRVTDNTSFQNSGPAILAFTRQLPATDNIFIGNTARDSDIGIELQGSPEDADTDTQANATRHDNTVIMSNILSRNRIALSLDPANPSSVRVQSNIFRDNGAALSVGDITVTTPSAISALYPYWRD